MLRPSFTLPLLALGLASASAHADSCTSVDTATPENFTTCSKEIRKALFDSTMPFELAKVEGQAFREFSPMSAPAVSYVYFTGGKPRYNQVVDSSYSTFKYGLFSLIIVGADPWNPTRLWVDGGHEWKGTILVPGGRYMDEILAYQPVYPLSAEVLTQIIATDGIPLPQKIDALAAYLPLLSDSEKVLVLMDFVRKPEMMAAGNELLPALTYLAGFKDSRSVRLFNDFIVDDRLAYYQRDILKIAANNGQYDAWTLNWMTDVLSSAECLSGLVDTIGEVFPARYPKFETAAASFASRCTTDGTQYYYSTASLIRGARRLKLKAMVLPAIDLLTAYVDVATKYTQSKNGMSSEFVQHLIDIISFLGESHSDRALPALHTEIYFNNPKYVEIVNATHKAISDIEEVGGLANIRKGSASAIKWGMDMITYHDGAKRALHFEILDAFEVAIRVNPSQKKRIQDYLKSEIKAGYHAYDPELVAAMKKVATL